MQDAKHYQLKETMEVFSPSKLSRLELRLRKWIVNLTGQVFKI